MAVKASPTAIAGGLPLERRVQELHRFQLEEKAERERVCGHLLDVLKLLEKRVDDIAARSATRLLSPPPPVSQPQSGGAPGPGAEVGEQAYFRNELRLLQEADSRIAQQLELLQVQVGKMVNFREETDGLGSIEEDEGDIHIPTTEDQWMMRKLHVINTQLAEAHSLLAKYGKTDGDMMSARESELEARLRALDFDATPKVHATVQPANFSFDAPRGTVLPEDNTPLKARKTVEDI